MQLVKHYVRLRNHFPSIKEGTRVAVSLQQLADILCCTTRNANFLLKRMTESSWITWAAGRGRGNLSQLTFHVEGESLLVELAQEQVRKGEIREALDLINDAHISTRHKTQFVEWLNSQFGFYTEAREKKKVDTLRFPLSSPFGTIDPAFALFSKEAHIVRQVFDTMVGFDPVSKQIKPHLSHYWEADSTHTEWTFYMRKDLLFHNGQECTSQDVAFTIRRLMDASLRSPYRWMFAQVEDILTPDPHTLVIRLKEPNHLFLHYMAAPHVSILPEAIVPEKGKAFFQLPVGTGPFQVTHYDDVKLILEAFPSYFQERAHLDRLEIWFIPLAENDSAQTDMFQMRYLSSHSSPVILPGWKGIEQLQAGCKYLALNLSKQGPQQHPSFRLALKHAIDYDRLIKRLPNKTFVLASCLLAEQEPSELVSAYDPELAKKLLREAGYQGETLLFYTHPHREKESFLISEMGREVGISIEVSLHPVEDILFTDKGREADLMCSDVVFDDDLLFSLLETLQTENSFFHTQIGETLSAFLATEIVQILREPDSGQQLSRLLGLAQQIIDHGAIIPLCRHKQTTYYDPSLKGVTLSSFGWVPFKNIWFQPERKTGWQ